MAKTKTKKEVPDIYDLAVELQEARHAKNEYTAIEKKLAAQLKARMNDGEKQDIFEFEVSRKLTVTDQEKAVAWAQANYPHLVTVDTKNIKTILQRALTPLPEGFEIEETKRLVEVGGANEIEE